MNERKNESFLFPPFLWWCPVCQFTVSIGALSLLLLKNFSEFMTQQPGGTLVILEDLRKVVHFESGSIWAPACCLSTGRRWLEVLKSPESHELRYLAPPPLRDPDVEAVSRSRNDPGWRRAMTAAGLVPWRQFAVGSGLETTGTSRTSRTSCPHFCKRQMSMSERACCQEFPWTPECTSKTHGGMRLT